MYQQRRQWKITWRGREVRSPAGRFAATVFTVGIGIPMMLLGLLMLIVTIPLSLPFHFIVRAFNGRGFFDSATGSYDVPAWVGFPIVVFVAWIILTAIS